MLNTSSSAAQTSDHKNSAFSSALSGDSVVSPTATKTPSFQPQHSWLKSVTKLGAKLWISLALLAVLAVGAVSAAYLATTTQDLRQQAAPTYIGVGGDCTSFAKKGQVYCADTRLGSCRVCGQDGKGAVAPDSACNGLACGADGPGNTPQGQKCGNIPVGDVACADSGKTDANCKKCTWDPVARLARFTQASGSECFAKGLICGISPTPTPKPTATPIPPPPTKTPIPSKTPVPTGIGGRPSVTPTVFIRCRATLPNPIRCPDGMACTSAGQCIPLVTPTRRPTATVTPTRAATPTVTPHGSGRCSVNWVTHAKCPDGLTCSDWWDGTCVVPSATPLPSKTPTPGRTTPSVTPRGQGRCGTNWVHHPNCANGLVCTDWWDGTCVVPSGTPIPSKTLTPIPTRTPTSSPTPRLYGRGTQCGWLWARACQPPLVCSDGFSGTCGDVVPTVTPRPSITLRPTITLMPTITPLPSGVTQCGWRWLTLCPGNKVCTDGIDGICVDPKAPTMTPRPSITPFATPTRTFLPKDSNCSLLSGNSCRPPLVCHPWYSGTCQDPLPTSTPWPTATARPTITPLVTRTPTPVRPATPTMTVRPTVTISPTRPITVAPTQKPSTLGGECGGWSGKTCQAPLVCNGAWLGFSGTCQQLAPTSTPRPSITPRPTRTPTPTRAPTPTPDSGRGGRCAFGTSSYCHSNGTFTCYIGSWHYHSCPDGKTCREHSTLGITYASCE